MENFEAVKFILISLFLIMLPIGGNILEDFRLKNKKFNNALSIAAHEEKFLIRRFCWNGTKKSKVIFTIFKDRV